MIFRTCYFNFFILGDWGGWVLEGMENSIHLFKTFPKLLAMKANKAFGNFFSTMRPGSMVLEFQEIEAIDLPELTEEEDYQGMLRTRFQIRFPRANAEWELHAYYYQVEYQIKKVRKRHGGREREFWQVRLGSMKKN